MSRLSTILEALAGRHGREAAISAPDLERITGIPERTIRRELEEAYDDGTLEELEMPAIGLPGVGFFLAASIDDFQEAYDHGAKVRAAWDRRLDGIKKLARSLGLHIQTK